MLAVYLSIQEYISTRLAAEKVLVWTPMLLVIDAGAMLQVFFLVIEGRAVKVGERTILMEPDEVPKRDVLPQNEPLANSFKRGVESLRQRFKPRNHPPAEAQNGFLLRDRQSRDNVRDVDDQEDTSDADTPSSWPAILAAAISGFLFLTIVVLQIYGLQAAWKLREVDRLPMTTWCSPSFQPFGIAMIDGNCNIYAIQRRDLQGIGCIEMEGEWQQSWLLGTAIGAAICLIFEVIDLLILSLVNGSRRFAKAKMIKMKRPWTTMIWGVIVLGITLFFGLQYAQSLPPRFTERVLIVADAGKLIGFDAKLSSAGLRGAVLAWSDGLFQSWGKAYFGSPASNHHTT